MNFGAGKCGHTPKLHRKYTKKSQNVINATWGWALAPPLGAAERESQPCGFYCGTGTNASVLIRGFDITGRDDGRPVEAIIGDMERQGYEFHFVGPSA